MPSTRIAAKESASASVSRPGESTGVGPVRGREDDQRGGGLAEVCAQLVLLVDHKKTGTKPELLSAALRLRHRLMSYPEVTDRINRIEFLHIACDGLDGISGIRADSRYA